MVRPHPRTPECRHRACADVCEASCWLWRNHSAQLQLAQDAGAFACCDGLQVVREVTIRWRLDTCRCSMRVSAYGYMQAIVCFQTWGGFVLAAASIDGMLQLGGSGVQWC